MSALHPGAVSYHPCHSLMMCVLCLHDIICIQVDTEVVRGFADISVVKFGAWMAKRKYMLLIL